MEAFTSHGTPERGDFDDDRYTCVVGPFKTKRAALWAEKHGYNNPHFQHVNDAERLSKHG